MSEVVPEKAPNRFIPRPTVAAWWARVVADPLAHEPRMAQLLGDHNAVAGYFVAEANAARLYDAPRRILQYQTGMALGAFDAVPGRLRKTRPEDVIEAKSAVHGAVGDMASFFREAGFQERARRFPRRQPYLLDELLDEVLTRTMSLAPAERAIVYGLLWVAVEAIDLRWQPGSAYIGLSSYTPPPA